MFAASCVFAVIVDPFFFYVPVINEDTKCMSLDKRLNIVAVTLRSLTDAIYLLNIILQFLCPYINEASRKLGRTQRYLFSGYFFIDALAVLPVPQILYPIIFSQIEGSSFFEGRKFLDAIVIIQYIPRVLRIYISWMNLTKASNRLANWWVKAGFSLCLYILASHVLGGFWYFFSIQRETACWHMACEKDPICYSIVFYCNHPSSWGDQKFVKDYCSADPPSAASFKFGIFSRAIGSGILESRDFPRKVAFCFWWGLRNLSSLGQNLETSTYFWENCFAVSISVSGLVLFLLFIGNMQTYLQMATERSEKIIQNMRVKEREVESWIRKNQLPNNIKGEIMPIIQRMLKEKKDVDVPNLLPHLPGELGRKIEHQICLPRLKEMLQRERKNDQLSQLICQNLKDVDVPIIQRMLKEKKDVDLPNLLSHLPMELVRDIKHKICLPLLKEVPQLKGKDDQLLQLICYNLKPVCYKEHSYIIQEGEPLDTMLFITQGILWNFAIGKGKRGAKCIERGYFYGEELLDWGFKDSAVPNLSELPIASKTAKTHTKVEAFALMANDLRAILSKRVETTSAVKRKCARSCPALEWKEEWEVSRVG